MIATLKNLGFTEYEAKELIRKKRWQTDEQLKVLAGVVSLDEKSRAAWSSHQGLVMPITEVVIHDLYIAEMLNAHRDILEESFGKDLVQLRQKFSLTEDNRKHYI